jgi:outer membrane protein assembly factor BamB
MLKIGITLLLCCLLVYTGSAQQLAWKFKTAGRVYSSATISGNNVFIGSGDSCLYALNRQTGAPLWKLRTGGAVHSTPVVYNHTVYAASFDGKLYAADEATGAIRWTFTSGGEKMYDLWDYYLSSPLISEGVLYWGSGDRNIYAIDPATGKTRWHYTTGDVVHATPVADSNRLYVGSFDGYLYCLDKNNGELLWKFKTIGDTYFPKGEIQKSVSVHNGIVYFGSRDYNIYALDAKKGTGHWNMKEKGSWIIATPLVYGGNVYFGTSDSHQFYALGAGYGEDRWKLRLNMRVYGSAVAADSTIFFGCFNGRLYGVEANSGKNTFLYQTEGSRKNYGAIYADNDEFRPDFALYGENFQESEKQIHTLGSILSTPTIAGNTIYFGSSDGYVYAVKWK